ncbi:hypothetical protein QM716_01120 [Rhodococcus sp. IEGM 1409]|uniref:hypothetical protein n=1 Tax=Rhodococcus sp. IEGM 1409 TaxID=3047082 RepID=UPI0024B70EB3|nr:hypothetical protein [Rhodococcus sp. IEGM 1409]MDI9898448.1 hypothetical protein [Rhodococcus sp. IEGM 1409]
MTTVHVRANQTTVDWAEGAEFVCERTPFVDNLIQHGGLTVIEHEGLVELDASDHLDAPREVVSDPSKPYVRYAEGGVVDAQDKVAAAYADASSSSEERRDAEKAIADSQADATAAQENLTEARTDAAETIAELNTELDNEPPKTTRPRRKSS